VSGFQKLLLTSRRDRVQEILRADPVRQLQEFKIDPSPAAGGSMSSTTPLKSFPFQDLAEKQGLKDESLLMNAPTLMYEIKDDVARRSSMGLTEVLNMGPDMSRRGS